MRQVTTVAKEVGKKYIYRKEIELLYQTRNKSLGISIPPHA
jgi:hypothetical protein